MLSDLQCAELCVGIYGYSGEPTVSWDHLELPQTDDGICWGLKRLDGYDVFVLRGSATIEDWWRDFDFIGELDTHPVLGDVHAGFFDGMPEAWSAMQALLQQPLVITGHSLGAGRAAIVAGLAIASGVVPVRRIVFGEPKPGFQQLADLLSNVPAASYRNGNDISHDPVTDVPIGLKYVHPSALTDVSAQPPVLDPWGPLAWHHMQLYRDALKSG